MRKHACNVRTLICFFFVALLVGCMGPGDLVKNDPTIAANTTKDPKRYALCVFPKWQNARADASMSETETGYRLLIASNNMADEMLDIVKTRKGSMVVLHQRMAWSMMPGRSAVESAVRSCL